MLHHEEWDSPKEPARRRTEQPRYSAAALSAISANEDVPRTFVYGRHNLKPEAAAGTVAQVALVDSESDESDFEDESTDDTLSEPAQSLTEPEFRQALGSFWDHVAQEVEEEEKARANKEIDACACPVTYHLPRGAEVKFDAQPAPEVKAPPRRRSLSTRHSFADSSSLSRFGSASPISTSTPRSVSRSASNPRGTSVHSYHSSHAHNHHTHHHPPSHHQHQQQQQHQQHQQHYHHSLSSRPVVMQSPHQRHRSYSISDSHERSSYYNNHRHQRTQSEDVLVNAQPFPLSARNLRSASIHGQPHRQQSFPASQRSPLASPKPSQMLQIPRPKSRNDIIMSSFSSGSTTPSPILRAQSLGTTSHLYFSRLGPSKATNQSPPKPTSSSSHQSPPKIHPKQSPAKKMRSPVRASPLQLVSDSSLSPRFPSTAPNSLSPRRQMTLRKQTPSKKTPPSKKLSTTPSKKTPSKRTSPPLKQTPSRQHQSPQKPIYQGSPQKQNSFQQSPTDQHYPLRYQQSTPQASPQKLFHASPTKQSGSISSPQKLFHHESPQKNSPQKLYQNGSPQRQGSLPLFQNSPQKSLFQGSPQKRGSGPIASTSYQDSPQKNSSSQARFRTVTPPRSHESSFTTIPAVSRLSPQKAVTPQLTSQKSSPQKFSPKKISPQKSPFKTLIPVGLHAPLRTAGSQDAYVPQRYHVSQEFTPPYRFQAPPQPLPSVSPPKLPASTSALKEIQDPHQIQDARPAPVRAILKKARSGLLPRASEGLEHMEKQSWWRSLGKSKDQKRNSLPVPEAKSDVTPPLWKRLVHSSKTSQKTQPETFNTTTPIHVTSIPHSEQLTTAQRGQLNSFFANAVLP